MIQAEKISKSFDDKMLFRDLSFTIQDGEYVCFSGESGTGKTTLLNIIGLLEPIDSGRLIINGKSSRKRKELQEYYRNEVGFLFQNFALIENKTVEQNLKIVITNDKNTVSMKDALRWVGLEQKQKNKVYTLSGGEQQRIALARLLIKPCSIILADEPTGSLDQRNAEIVMTLLERLHTLGKTVILVSHDDAIKQRAERIIYL